jgi:hypothetical protein
MVKLVADDGKDPSAEKSTSPDRSAGKGRKSPPGSKQFDQVPEEGNPSTTAGPKNSVGSTNPEDKIKYSMRHEEEKKKWREFFEDMGYKNVSIGQNRINVDGYEYQIDEEKDQFKYVGSADEFDETAAMILIEMAAREGWSEVEMDFPPSLSAEDQEKMLKVFEAALAKSGHDIRLVQGAQVGMQKEPDPVGLKKGGEEQVPNQEPGDTTSQSKQEINDAAGMGADNTAPDPAARLKKPDAGSQTDESKPEVEDRPNPELTTPAQTDTVSDNPGQDVQISGIDPNFSIKNITNQLEAPEDNGTPSTEELKQEINKIFDDRLKTLDGEDGEINAETIINFNKALFRSGNEEALKYYSIASSMYEYEKSRYVDKPEVGSPNEELEAKLEAFGGNVVYTCFDEGLVDHVIAEFKNGKPQISARKNTI